MKKEKQEEARILRKRGFTIPEIEKIIGCPRSSISNWVKGVKISSVVRQRMREREYQRRGEASKSRAGQSKPKLRRPSFRLKECLTAEEQRLKDAFLMLYYGEGAKTSNGVMICNADSNVIKVSLLALRQTYRVIEERIHCRLSILDMHDEDEQKEYWRQVTGVNKFYKSTIKKYDAKKHKRNFHGVIYIYVNDITLKELIIREINELTNKLLCTCGAIGSATHS